MSPYTKIKIKLFLLDCAFNLIVFSIIGIFAYFNDKLFEISIFYCSWLGLRYIMPKIFHFKFHKSPIINILGCLIWSVIIFCFSTINLLPIGVSLFSSVILSATINLGLYYLQDYIDYKIAEINRNRFDVKTCSKEELIERCEEKGFSEQDIKQCVTIFKSGLKGQDLYSALCYCPRQVKNLRKKYKQLLDN